MKAQEIRERFSNFFIKNGHEKIASSSLIPHNDPTILFANAGMNQFKDYFVGKANPKNKRAVTVQKCVRAGGKHNDLENVGYTARHHTFFEMLGNFSFGDYFKKDAISFAWKFLTEELKIPKDKLYITVHESDEEARMIWHKEQGVPLERIFYKGDKDNFWEMGDVGPCGPCTEIFVDHGPERSDGQTHKELLDDELRYVEIWNLVFMQYEKYKDGNEIKRKPLPKPSVDTGAGLERIAAFMQNKYFNYDSDLFLPIMNKLETLSGKKYSDPKYSSSFRVVADHIRSSTMLITDGAIPSNEGRGYVLRRIIRRAIRHLEELGLKDVCFYKLVPSVFESLGMEYKENMANAALAEKLLKLEEEKFRKTLEVGLNLIHEEINKLSSGKLFSGETAFKLYDTYGFPLDLTEVILKDKNIKLDTNGFEASMKKQKEASKKTTKFSANEDNLKIFYSIKEKFGATTFTGYTEEETSAKLIAKEIIGEITALVFDKSPFYAESGGQLGDTGTILDNVGVIATIIDSQKPVDGLHVHYSNNADAIEIGNTYKLKIDSANRSLTAKNHSATHILQAALMEVLGPHVKQAGSSVGPDRLRFDFTHPEALTLEQISEVEKIVNLEISKSLSVSATVTDKENATKMGAIALFGEKYGDSVRVIKMGNFSCELCGGTHVKNTSEIGQFIILSEGSLASGVRRIEALTNVTAFNYLKERNNILVQVEKNLSVKGDKVIHKLDNLESEIKMKQKEIDELSQKIQGFQSKDLFSNSIKLQNGVSLIIAEANQFKNSDFKSLSDKFAEKFDKAVLFLYQTNDGKFSFLVRSNNLKEVNCSDILKPLLPTINGRGGGKPDMVQGSGELGNHLKLIESFKSGLSTK
jgi:alanyl-tRNA synthetase